MLAFCQSIGPSSDINGNQVPLSTRRKTCLPVQPQLFELENPNDPNLKCTTCDKVIGNNCALHYCRPCRRVRICDNKNCAILHHCKIRKPFEAFPLLWQGCDVQLQQMWNQTLLQQNMPACGLEVPQN